MCCGGDHKITEDYYNDKEEALHMELQKGRPQDTTGRLAKEIRTYDLLDQLGISYERIDHAPAMTMEDCQEIDEALQATVCKNLFLCNRQETAFYLLMIPDTKTFHTKDLSAQIGSARLSFAKPEYMEKLLIDEDVLSGEMIGCHPCINTSSIRFKTSDLIEKILPAMHHSFIQVKL